VPGGFGLQRDDEVGHVVVVLAVVEVGDLLPTASYREHRDVADLPEVQEPRDPAGTHAPGLPQGSWPAQGLPGALDGSLYAAVRPVYFDPEPYARHHATERDWQRFLTLMTPS